MSLAFEASNIQNPALGAMLLWRFTCGYVNAHPTKDGAYLPMAYVVLPMLLHKKTQIHVNGTIRASGLRGFAAKFAESKNAEQDILVALHNRSMRWRNLSTNSISLAIACGMLHLSGEGVLLPLTSVKAEAGIGEGPRELMRNAEKIGAWFAQLTPHEVGTILKVRL
ncbi:MAG TPA: three component ABC system middle component [Fimbriimonadaceae bacterium]|jgi:hypothetical protein